MDARKLPPPQTVGDFYLKAILEELISQREEGLHVTLDPNDVVTVIEPEPQIPAHMGKKGKRR